MCEPADRNTVHRGDTSLAVGGPLRSPMRHVDRVPRDGIFNIRRDAGLARDAYGEQLPALDEAATRARQAQIADNVEELDGHVLTLIVAAQALLIARGFGGSLHIWAAVQVVRDEGPADEPKLGPAIEQIFLVDGTTTENLIRLIAGAERTLEQLRTAFPDLTVRHTP